MENIFKSSPLKSLEMREHYCEMLQNSVLFSPVYGHAGIHEGLPYYYNGKNLLVVGYSMDNSQKELDTRIGRVVTIARERWSNKLQSIQFWGPIRPNDLIIPNDFVRVGEREPDNANCDVILSLDAVSYKRVKNGRDIRRALRNGLTVSINVSKKTTSEHSELYRKFFKTHANIEKEDIVYFTSWREVLANHDSFLFEVKQGECLTGFAILNCFGKHTATYAYGFFNNSVAGTSDLIHGAMIEYCYNSGFDMLDLGYSINSKLLSYKKKWGNTRLVDPPWSVYWEWRGRLEKKKSVN